MQKDYIPGIYNYCDRWCAKCPFTRKCSHFTSIPGLPNREVNIHNENFWEEINSNFQDAINLVKEWVEDQGLDWKTFEKEINEQEFQEPNLTKEQIYIKSRALKYSQKVRIWFEKNQNFLQQKETEINTHLKIGIENTIDSIIHIKNAIEVIDWYQSFIGAKIARAVEMSHDEWVLKENPIQNDANGSAKIAFIAIKRSLAAWETLRSHFPDKTDDFIDILILLDKMRKEILTLFPNLDKFIRPGFDEK